MATLLAFRASLNTGANREDHGGLATCPKCHSVDATVTTAAVRDGAGWRCARCTQYWDRARLAAVAAYSKWLDTHEAVASPTPT